MEMLRDVFDVAVSVQAQQMGSAMMTMIRACSAALSGLGVIGIRIGHGHGSAVYVIEMNVQRPRRIADEGGEEQ